MQGMFVIPPPPGEIQMYYMNMMMMRKKKEEALKRILSSKELNEPHIETNGEMMKYLLDTEIAQNFIHEFHDNHTIRPESLLNIAQRLKAYATEIKNRKAELIDEFPCRYFINIKIPLLFCNNKNSNSSISHTRTTRTRKQSMNKVNYMTCIMTIKN